MRLRVRRCKICLGDALKCEHAARMDNDKVRCSGCHTERSCRATRIGGHPFCPSCVPAWGAFFAGLGPPPVEA